jgi:hypothetical protein
MPGSPFVYPVLSLIPRIIFSVIPNRNDRADDSTSHPAAVLSWCGLGYLVQYCGIGICETYTDLQSTYDIIEIIKDNLTSFFFFFRDKLDLTYSLVLGVLGVLYDSTFDNPYHLPSTLPGFTFLLPPWRPLNPGDPQNLQSKLQVNT